jgi:DNA-binding XRE family transcriptional regulator
MNPPAIPTTGAELRRLRESMGLDQVQMGRLIGVGREWVSKLENDKQEFSEFVRLKLTSIMASGPTVAIALAEDPAPFNSGKSLLVSTALRGGVSRSERMQVNPAFATPAAMPTRHDCEAHIAAYLDAAAHVPGGYAIALHKIKRALPLDEFAPAENSSP